MRQYVKRSLVSMLILGMVNLAVPASARAADDEIARTEVTSKTALLAPNILQRSITAAAHRAALQAPQTGNADASHSRKGCLIGGVLLGGAAAAFVTAWAKHRSWADSGATTTPGAKPPSSVGWSVAIGAVLAGGGIFTMSKTCGE
jgi:hypothetical protein